MKTELIRRKVQADLLKLEQHVRSKGQFTMTVAALPPSFAGFGAWYSNLWDRVRGAQAVSYGMNYTATVSSPHFQPPTPLDFSERHHSRTGQSCRYRAIPTLMTGIRRQTPCSARAWLEPFVTNIRLASACRCVMFPSPAPVRGLKRVDRRLRHCSRFAT